MSREMMETSLQCESQRRHHGMLCRLEEPIPEVLQSGWQKLVEQAGALVPSRPTIRVRPVTLCIELEDLLAEWRELWSAKWFAGELDELITSEWTLKDVIAHVASWSREMRAQAEILGKGSTVGYRILFEKVGGPRSWNAEQVALRRSQPVEELIEEIERETTLFQDLLLAVEQTILFVERPIGIAMAATGAPWIRSIAGIVEMRCYHDRMHLHRIREWRLGRSIGES
jgi:Mycothiol maleylpyruvate isomerase N-terminal domain